MFRRIATTAFALTLPLWIPATASANSSVDTEVVRHTHRGQSARATNRGLVGLDVGAGNTQADVRPRDELLTSREQSLSTYFEHARAKAKRHVAKKRAISKPKKAKKSAASPAQESGFDALSCLDGFGGEAHRKQPEPAIKQPVTTAAATSPRRRVSRGLRTPVSSGL